MGNKRNQASQYNPFDELGINLDPEEIKRQQAKQTELHERLDRLIHQTFAQTDSGVELLALWNESLQITPGAVPGMKILEVGIIEGKKAFIRNIILTIRKVEDE